MDEHVGTIIRFLEEIGIPVIARELPEPTFLPGLTIDAGAVVYDPPRLTYPGDLLHEAGHIAMTPAAARQRLSPQSTFDLGFDLAAIAWSWAALLHLGLPPAILFHDGGYCGSNKAYIENFSARRYVGVPLLAWAGLTREPHRATDPAECYPSMIKWLAD